MSVRYFLLLPAGCAVFCLLGAAAAGRGRCGTSRRKAAKKPARNTTKLLVWLCLGNGIAWVWCSYLLAYLGRAEIAESLSRAAVTEIIGVVLVYAVKSLVENLSRHNTWPDRPEDRKIRRDCD